DYGQCDVGSWIDITQVAAGYEHTVGLKSDGTVVAVGRNNNGQGNVAYWTSITQIAAGYSHTVGLKSDGTVVATGDNYYGQCNVAYWTGISQVAAGYFHTVGLKSDGTVVAAGDNYSGQCDVDDWMNITQAAAGRLFTLGLEDDDIVIATSLVVHWNLSLALPPLRYPPPPPPIPPSTGCFIATAAYGTPIAEEIQILREFRDEYLLTNPLGRALVDFYYRVSPPIAEFITEHPSLKPIVRVGLWPAVVISAVIVNADPT
ncbi:MAG: hypothetical protein E3J60_02815, partial [Dehalococcoidia bacterium]